MPVALNNDQCLPRKLLGCDDPLPVEWINPDSRSPILLVCEHAGQDIPHCLESLGLCDDVIDSHIGWDIGAESVARGVAKILNAPLILQRYSRLVIDCNRPPGCPSSIPERSDGIAIPGNTGINKEQIAARQSEIFGPFNQAIDDALAMRERIAAFSIHSFTPMMGGQPRPWHAGFLTRHNLPTANKLINCIAEKAPGLALVLNQPYEIEDDTDWFIPMFAEKQNLAHSLIEIRNDQLQDDEGTAYWSALLASAISDVVEDR
jgi:predicted N-formylglutamate amidohydrolase